MVGTANCLNITQQGMVYFDGQSVFTGIDGGDAGDVLTSNGTGQPPSFQPASSGVVVSAYLDPTVANVTGDGTAFSPVFNNTFVNNGGAYNTTTGVFTAPSDGNYLVNVQLTFAGISALNTTGFFVIRAGGGNRQALFFNPFATFDATNAVSVIEATAMIPLTAGITVDFVGQISGGALNVSLFGNSGIGLTSTMSIAKMP